MIQLLGFGLFIVFGVLTLVVLPVFLHPTLPLKRKWLLAGLAFVVLVPLGVALYAWLGVPPMAQYS